MIYKSSYSPEYWRQVETLLKGPSNPIRPWVHIFITNPGWSLWNEPSALQCSGADTQYRQYLLPKLQTLSTKCTKRSCSQDKYSVFGIFLIVQNMMIQMFFCPFVEGFGIDRVFGMILTKGQIKPKAARCRFSEKNEQTNLLGLLFCYLRQTKQIHLFILWETLCCAVSAFGFI